jgi:hypothetical protein
MVTEEETKRSTGYKNPELDHNLNNTDNGKTKTTYKLV